MNFYSIQRKPAPVAQLDRAAGFEPVGRGFESLRAQVYRAFALALCVALSSCAAPRRKQAVSIENQIPIVVAVVPVGNASQDITLPFLLRYCLEEELRAKGFKLSERWDDVDAQLRQMGITEAYQINEGNLQNIGSSLKAEGILQAKVLQSTQSKDIKTIGASFKIVSVITGQVLWENRVEIEEKAGGRLPVKGTVTNNWTLKEIRSLAKSSAGKLPKKIARDGLKTLRR